MRGRVNDLTIGMTLAFVLLCSCTKKPEADLFPAGSPMAGPIHFQFAVYMLPVPRKDPLAALHQALHRYSGLKLVAAVPKDPSEMTVSVRTDKNVQLDYSPPDSESLQSFGHGINAAQARALLKSKDAFVLDFAHPKEKVWTALRSANSLVEDIARSTGGLVWDEGTREIFTPDAWHEKRLASWTDDVPDMSTQTVIHIYKDDEFVRAITLGMAKAGLPDVVVSDFTWSEENQIADLINIFSQSIAEGAALDKSGRFRLNLRAIKNPTARESQIKALKANAIEQGCLSLKPGIAEEGDPDNRLIQITFDRYDGHDFHARRDQMLTSFFGSATDSVTHIQHNQELLDASNKARTKLPELEKAFNSGLLPGEYIQIKEPFQTPDGGTEWMWVEVSHWEGNRIKGLLENDPEKIPDLHSGELVEVRAEDVFDYIHYFPDKHSEGNTTGAILKKMDEQGEAVKTSVPEASSESVVKKCTAD